ncbi:MAG: hypothetical protein SFZ03_03150 [Candidatus Melainabacteria bacterium]|nr:hypothetical protein [Candidatus Melainabacteria bacterium]
MPPVGLDRNHAQFQYLQPVLQQLDESMQLEGLNLNDYRFREPGQENTLPEGSRPEYLRVGDFRVVHVGNQIENIDYTPQISGSGQYADLNENGSQDVGENHIVIYFGGERGSFPGQPVYYSIRQGIMGDFQSNYLHTPEDEVLPPPHNPWVERE